MCSKIAPKKVILKKPKKKKFFKIFGFFLKTLWWTHFFSEKLQRPLIFLQILSSFKKVICRIALKLMVCKIYPKNRQKTWFFSPFFRFFGVLGGLPSFFFGAKSDPYLGAHLGTKSVENSFPAHRNDFGDHLPGLSVLFPKLNYLWNWRRSTQSNFEFKFCALRCHVKMATFGSCTVLLQTVAL